MHDGRIRAESATGATLATGRVLLKPEDKLREVSFEHADSMSDGGQVHSGSWEGVFSQENPSRIMVLPMNS